jgi:hydroxymethylpyrimidine pyrophosphatase-like HAD family hydrolase
MGNAPLFVKKNANHIARSNNDAGVAKYLSDILPL